MATATATPLQVTADPSSTLNNNGEKRKTTWEKRNQERRAKEKALSKQTGSPSSDEDVFGDLDLLYDLDATNDRELDEFFAMPPSNGPPLSLKFVPILVLILILDLILMYIHIQIWWCSSFLNLN